MSTANAPGTALTAGGKPAAAAIATTQTKTSIFRAFANRYEMDADKVMTMVTSTVFKGGRDEPPLSPEEVAAALIVCNEYNLNPFTKEIYAFRSKGKLLVVVGVDGWSTIINRQATLNGVEFEEHFDDNGNIQAVTCKIHRKDRAMPTVVTEYTRECYRETEPWKKMPTRMTRNRALVQCARIAFSISGIVDEDEAGTFAGHPIAPGQPIIEGEAGATRSETVKNAIKANKGKAVAAAPAAEPEQAKQQTLPQQDAEPVQHNAAEDVAAPATIEGEAQPAQAEAPKKAESW